MRVLAVHDTRAMRTIVTRALHHLEGVEHVSQAEGAEEAIELLQREPIDLVLCDWNLRGMTGIEFLEALRAAEWNVPFGFITAESDGDIRRRALASGAAFLLTKPITEHELARALSVLDERVGDFSLDELADLPVASDSVDGERAAHLEELLVKLCDTAVHVRPVKEGPDRRTPRYVACYNDAHGQLAAFCIVSASIGLAAAASLTRWSPKLTLEWARTGVIPEELLEDLFEVANVLAQFVRPDHQRVVLHSLEGYAPGEPFDAIERVNNATGREHFDVEVVGYCGGRCTVVAL